MNVQEMSSGTPWTRCTMLSRFCKEWISEVLWHDNARCVDLVHTFTIWGCHVHTSILSLNLEKIEGGKYFAFFHQAGSVLELHRLSFLDSDHGGRTKGQSLHYCRGFLAPAKRGPDKCPSTHTIATLSARLVRMYASREHLGRRERWVGKQAAISPWIFPWDRFCAGPKKAFLILSMAMTH
jgi:hypothetical protein